ncbi:MAG: glycoside hydrolase family 2 protein [Candidatus Hodarchaeota archaeon]
MKVSLNGEWRYNVDLKNEGENSGWMELNWISMQYCDLKKISLPNCWNTIPELERFEGILWFFKELPKISPDLMLKDLFIEFKAVNYFAKVWINEIEVGKHEGGFLPFRLKIPQKILKLSSENFIAVRVENFRKKDRIPCRSFDWYNYGGIYRDIKLLVMEKLRIDWVGVQTQIGKRVAQINVKYKLINPVRESIDEIKWKLIYLGIQSSHISHSEDSSKLEKEGSLKPSGLHNEFSITVSKPHLWTPEAPHLYRLELQIVGSNNLPNIVRFGIRTIKAVGTSIYLNKRIIKLYGVSLHEELIPYGRTIPKDERRQDVLNIKALGFNALRTAHYPHDESIYDICDEEGLLVIEEIPVYWGLDFTSNDVLRLALRMLHSMIRRDFNHPSIIMWSAGNEIPLLNRSCRKFMTILLRYGKKIDNSRLISCVLEFWTSLALPRSFTRELDVLCCNQYIGWYYLNTHNLSIFLDSLYQHFGSKPWLITEFGAGAKYENHDYSKIPAKFSEERQASIISHSVRTMISKQYISGWFIWIYRDFRSHMRINEYQDGFNRKGIVSEINQEKIIARKLPALMNKEIKKKKKAKHELINFRVVLFYWFLYPLIVIASMITSLIQGKFYDTGDKFYLTESGEKKL